MRNYFFSSSITYLAISLIQPLISLLLLPFITRTYDVQTYGIFILLSAVMMFFSFIGGGAIQNAMSNYHFQYIENKAESVGFLYKVLSYATIANVIIAVIATVIYLLIPASRLNLSMSCIIIALLAGLFDVYQAVITQYYKNHKNVYKVLYYFIVTSALFAFLQIIVIFNRMDISLLLLAKVVSVFIATAFFIPKTKSGKQIFYLNDIKGPIKYSLKLLPWITITWILYYGDRIIIEKIFDSSNLALYGLTLTIAGFIQMAYTGAGSAILPVYQTNFINKKANSNYKLPFFGVHIAGIVFILILLFAPTLPIILGEAYKDISLLLGYAAFAFFVTSIQFGINAKWIAERNPTIVGVNNSLAGLFFFILIFLFNADSLINVLIIFMISKIISVTVMIGYDGFKNGKNAAWVIVKYASPYTLIFVASSLLLNHPSWFHLQTTFLTIALLYCTTVTYKLFKTLRID